MASLVQTACPCGETKHGHWEFWFNEILVFLELAQLDIEDGSLVPEGTWVDGLPIRLGLSIEDEIEIQ